MATKSNAGAKEQVGATNDAALIGGVLGALILLVFAVMAAIGFVLWRRVRQGNPEQPRENDVAMQARGADRPNRGLVGDGPAAHDVRDDRAAHYASFAADFRFPDSAHYDRFPADNADVGTLGKGDSGVVSPLTGSVSLSPGSSLRSQNRESEFMSARIVAWEIDAADVELGAVIGQGNFGVVRRGQWHGRTVAVKQIKKSTVGDALAVAAFEEEIGRMVSLQRHENVVQLYGVVTLPNGDIGAVVEFCAQGALVDALYGEKARTFDDDELVQIAYDSACGLMHLHASNMVHRDVSARNVLLAGKKDLTAKVSDFGMAREVNNANSGASQQTATVIGPIRWMAPEQLSHLSYSKSSDIFAFGVLLFEIFAREAPWAGVSNVNVITHVMTGRRMAVPANAPIAVRELMARCWLPAAKERPNVKEVCAVLNQLQNVQ
jgi:hypothetical protein